MATTSSNESVLAKPNFDQIARQFFIDYRGDPIAALAEQFRLVWNARGAADIKAVNAAYLTAPLDHVINALLSLDR